MTEFLRTLFSWPNGIVVGNLLASAIWATPSLIMLHRKLNRHHREHLDAIQKRKAEEIHVRPPSENSSPMGEGRKDEAG